jgi:hypothetical protein
MMRNISYAAIIALALLATATAHGDFTGKGHVHKIAESKEVFANPDCHLTGSCDLKRFTLTKVQYEVWFSDDPIHPTYGNGVIIEYETDSIAALENYAVVQFKKGCVFHSWKNGAGDIYRNISDVVPSFGETIPFCFRHWVIDSQDSDPAYNSDPEYGRHYLLRWNKPGSYDNRTQKFYGAQKPRRPILYMTDYPAGAFITGTGVRNVSLEFKTCIYKASEVPAETSRDNIHFAHPLACFDWQNVYVYDFAKASFQTELASLPLWEEPSETTPRRRAANDKIILLIVMVIALTAVSICKWRRRKSLNRS